MATLYVSSDYNSSIDGWGTTYFNTYSSAYSYAINNAKSSTIVIKNGSGNIVNEHKNYSSLNITVEDGAKATYEGNKLDMTYDVVIKAGGTLESTRKLTQATVYTHIKNNGSLTIGEAGAAKKAVFNFGAHGNYRSNDVAVLYNGTLTANNAIIAVGDFGFTGSASFTDTEITVQGIVAFGKGGSQQTMTNSTMTVIGHNLRNENTYFSNAGILLNKLTMTNSTITVDDNVDTTVAERVILNTLTMKDGSALEVEEGTQVRVIGTVTANASTITAGNVELFKSNSMKITTGKLAYGTYRAVLLDNDGNEVYSVSIKQSDDDAAVAISYTFQYELAGEYTAVVYNSSGDTVYSKAFENTLTTSFANLTLNDSDFTATNFDIYNANVTLENGSTLTVDKFYLSSAGGTFTMDYTSTLAFSSVAWGKNANDIIINTTDYTSGTYQIIDYTGPADDPMLAEHYQFMLGDGWNDNYKVINGDLYLSNVDTSVVYVNSAWAGKEIGETFDGYTFGFNAFADFTTAYNSVAAAGTVTIVGNAEFSTGTWDKNVNIVVKDGAVLTGKYSWDPQFTEGSFTIEAGGKIEGVPGNNYYFKKAFVMAGTAEKAAVFDGYVDANQSYIDLHTRWGGSFTADYADITAGMFYSNAAGATISNSKIYAALTVLWQNLTVTNSNIEIRGVKYSDKAGAMFENTTLTNSTLKSGTGWERDDAKTADNIKSLTLNNSKAYFMGDEADTIATLTITGSNALAEFDAGVTISNTLTVQNGAKVNFKAAVNNAGTINIDAASKLTATSITGTGTITIDATNFAGGVVKVIDQTDGTSLEGKVTVTGGNANVIYGADGDVVLSNLAVSTIYVNSAWAGTEVGTEVETGSEKYFGINAVSDLASIANMINTDGTATTIKFESDIVSAEKVIEFNYGAGNITFTADKDVTIEQTTLGTDWVFVKGNIAPTITIGKNVTFKIYDNASGLYVYYGAGLKVDGTITGGQGWGCTYLAFGEHSISKTGTISTGRVQLSWTKITVNGTIDTQSLIVADTTFTATGATVKAASFKDNDSAACSEFYFTDSTLITNSLTLNANTIFNVTGASTLNIGTLTGTILVADATLTESAISKGSVNFKGQNSFSGDFNASYAYVGDWTNETYTGNIDFGTNSNVNVGGQMIIGHDYSDMGDNNVVFGDTTGAVVTDKVFKAADVSVRRDGTLTIANTTGDNKISTMNVMGQVIVDNAKLSGEVQIGSGANYNAEMIVRNGAEVTLGGSSNSVVILGKNTKGAMSIDNATVTIQRCGAGAGYTVPADTFLIGYNGGKGELNLTNNALFEAIDYNGDKEGGKMNVNISADSVVSVTGSTFKVAGVLDNAGVFNINCATTLPTITVGSMQNTGTINFTVAEGADFAGAKVIDAADNSNYGDVTINGLGAGFEAISDGEDLYVVNTSVIKVDTSFTAESDCGAGFFFGINAFASLEDITTALSQGAREVQFTYNGTDNGFAEGLEITVKNDDGASLIYTFGGQVYASVGGNNVHEFAPESGSVYIFDFKQGNYSFAVNEIKANGATDVTPETGSNSASGTVNVDVNEFSGRKDIGFTVATGMEGAIELDIKKLDGAAWVVLYDAKGKTVKEHVVIRDGKLTFDGLEAGVYTVAISAAGIPSEVSCKVDYDFNQEAVVVTDDTWNNANLFGIGTTAGTTVSDKFTATDVIDWFRFSADGVNAINFTGDGDFSVIAYTKNGDKLQQCAAFWVFNDAAGNEIDYTRYLNVAAGDVYLRIEGYGKEVNYTVALATQA